MIVLLAVACSLGPPPSPMEEESEVTMQLSCVDAEAASSLQIFCPALPATSATGTIQNGVLDYDLWAWNSFVALNWPALDPETHNNQRGFPDLYQRFDQEKKALTVWETLKEKREIFLANPQTRKPVPDPKPAEWNAPPRYGPADSAVPCCTGFDCSIGHREMHGAKLNSAFDTLDETAEVASEARETNEVLCRGHGTDCANPHGQAVGPRVWRGQPAPGKPANNPVVYEVKVNYDFFNYVQQFGYVQKNGRCPETPSSAPFYPDALWIQGNARKAAKNGRIRLPFRTSGAENPPRPRGTSGIPKKKLPGPNECAVRDYSADAALKHYRMVAEKSDLLPFKTGAVHLKAAWMELKRSADAPGDFHTTNGFTFTKDPHTGNTCKKPSDNPLGLIGLHIIQRIHEQQSDNSAHPRGGTFVFATWEHRGNDHQGFTYANLYPTTSDSPDPYPNVNAAGVDALPLKRAYDIPSTTMSANEMMWTALDCPKAYGSDLYGDGTGKSVWCNYMLVGTQYMAVAPPTPQPELLSSLPAKPMDPQKTTPPVVQDGQPYYLANLVVESNVGLQQFQGLPPNQAPIDHFANPTPPPGNVAVASIPGVTNRTGASYDHDAENIAFRIAPNAAGDHAKRSGQQLTPTGPLNMGGCMGCHGVAQLNGYAFSFVLLGNQAGAAPDTQDTVDTPPPPPAPNLASAIFLFDNHQPFIALSAKGDGPFSFQRTPGFTAGFTPAHSPALASFGGSLFYALTANNGQIFIATRAPGSQPLSFQIVDKNARVASAPALASFKDRLYYAFVGKDGFVHVASSATGGAGTFGPFDHAEKAPTTASASAPALAALGGKLYLAIAGTGGSLHLASSKTGEAGSFVLEPVHGEAALPSSAPALASFRDRLFLAYTDMHGRPLIASSATGDAKGFGEFRFAENVQNISTSSPALAAYLGSLYYGFSGANYTYLGPSATGEPGSFAFRPVGSLSQGQSPTAPALAALP